MSRRAVIITIDGPAGTGKSTVAHLLADRLGLEFLDTGAMYRAAALLALDMNIDPADENKLADALEKCDLSFDWEKDPPCLILDGRDISERIRESDIGEIVSIVAAQPAVRAKLVDLQRHIANQHPRLVSEGRDQGSVVFPHADLRFYLDADESVRARRRVAQLVASGKSVDPKRVAVEIRERDHLDSTRSDGPLIKPPGAIEIDTTHLSADEVVAKLESISRDRLSDAGFPA